MKKLFTLMVMALVAMSASAEERVTLWEGEQTFGSDWPSVQIALATVNEKAELKEGDAFIVTVSKADNAINTGWSYGPQVFINMDWATLFSAKSIENGATNVEVKFVLTDAEITKMASGTELEFQGMNATISKIQVEINEVIEYEETATNIEFDEYGNITSDKFAGFSDKAKVVFTISATGEATNAQGSIIGWGIGTITSLDNSVKVDDLGLKQIGDNDYTFVIADLKAALEAPKNEYDMQGINWNVWNQGNATCTRKSVKVYEVKGASEGGEESATALIDYPTSKDGITIGTGVDENNSQKYHANTDNVDNISFGSGYTSDGVINGKMVTLEVDGGFKAGDKVIVAGYFNNSDENKQAAVQIFTGATGEAPTVLWTSELFINGRTVADDPAEQTYTLEADAASLNMGRANGLSSATRTNVILLKVVRDGGATGIQEIPVKVVYNDAIYNLAGQKVNETYKGIVIKDGKKYIQK